MALPASIASLDRLLVFGIKGSLDSAASAQRLSELFAAHSYTQGFSFLAPGTPSNNTAETPSGFTSFDPGYDTSFQTHQEQETPSGASNAGLIAKALGIPAAAFTRMEQAGADEMTGARHMNTALWQTTWGYFLDQMMGDALPEDGPKPPSIGCDGTSSITCAPPVRSPPSAADGSLMVCFPSVRSTCGRCAPRTARKCSKPGI
jgi:hypothetical protein